MRVHHLNCGSMCPYGGRLMDGFTKGIGPAHLVCHCLLIETDQGLILVDTGLGLNDIREPFPRLAPFFLSTLRPQLTENETAVRQIESRGYRREDVRHIVLTHLDFDHAGGLDDFPNATVHLLEAEYQAAFQVKSLVDVGRYRPGQWKKFRSWKRYQSDSGGESWFGFECVRALDGLPPEILLVPLVGHTWGHSGVAVQTDRGWLLHAGDAYFYRNEIRSEDCSCTPGLKIYQSLMEVDRKARLVNQHRLRQLHKDHANDVRIFSSHDKIEFDVLLHGQSLEAGRRMARPSVATVHSPSVAHSATVTSPHDLMVIT